MRLRAWPSGGYRGGPVRCWLQAHRAGLCKPARNLPSVPSTRGNLAAGAIPRTWTSTELDQTWVDVRSTL